MQLKLVTANGLLHFSSENAFLECLHPPLIVSFGVAVVRILVTTII